MGNLNLLMKSLTEFAAEQRLAIFERLRSGQPPEVGDYSETALAEAKLKGQPQMGSTRFEPDRLFFEFIFSGGAGPAYVLTVSLEAPERIVFMPVPNWVVETIWQGSIDGTYCFESHAKALLTSFEADLEKEANLKWFGPRQAMRRE